MALMLISLLAVIWSPPISFKARWVEMPAAMTWETITKARKAAERPSFCMYNFEGTPCRII
jgi:hypothetical protein